MRGKCCSVIPGDAVIALAAIYGLDCIYLRREIIKFFFKNCSVIIRTSNRGLQV